jgi:hypothetical protein
MPKSVESAEFLLGGEILPRGKLVGTSSGGFRGRLVGAPAGGRTLLRGRVVGTPPGGRISLRGRFVGPPAGGLVWLKGKLAGTPPGMGAVPTEVEGRGGVLAGTGSTRRWGSRAGRCTALSMVGEEEICRLPGIGPD